MKQVNYVVYFSNSTIYLYDRKKEILFSDTFLSLKNDEIYNQYDFDKEFNNFIKKNKIKLSILGNNIVFLTNYEFSPFYKRNFQELLLEYFKSVTFVNVTDFLNVSNKLSYLNITDDYIDYYYFKNAIVHQRISLSIFNNNIMKTCNHILTIYKPKKIYIYGNSTDIPKISNQLNKESTISVMFVENYSSYVIKSFMDFKCCKKY